MQKVLEAAPLCIFWTLWKERNMLAFDNAEFSIQRMKNSFVDVDPLSLFSFIDWLNSKWGQVTFFVSLPPPLGSAFGWPVHISGVLWDAVLAFPFLYIYSLFLPIQKKKNHTKLSLNLSLKAWYKLTPNLKKLYFNIAKLAQTV